LRRRVLRFGAIIGVATVSALAVGPAFAAATVSQATAQSVTLDIAGNSAISQKITATNDGTAEDRTDTSTVPKLADLLTGNNVLGAGVAPQDAHANADGTSYACAGIAGPASDGVVTVGKKQCTIDGSVLTLNLGDIDLDLVHILGSEGALTGPLNDALSPVTLPVGTQLDDVVSQLSDGLADTPLGQVALNGSLSVIEAACTANPSGAVGDAQILDTAGDRKLPISVTIPDGSGGTKTLDLVNLDVNLEPKPGGTDVLVNLDAVSQELIDAIEVELDTAVGGALSQVSDALKPVLQAVQDQIVEQLVDALREPLLQQLSDNVLKLVVNDRTYGDNGSSVDVTALRAEVLPAAKQFAGASLVDGRVGHVTCGPNRVATPEVQSPTTPDLPDVPTVVDSGLAGHQDHTARNVLGATAALLLLAGAAGLMSYRRMLDR